MNSEVDKIWYAWLDGVGCEVRQTVKQNILNHPYREIWNQLDDVVRTSVRTTIYDDVFEETRNEARRELY